MELNVNGNAQTEEKEKIPFSISVSAVSEFPSIGDTAITTTEVLTKQLNGIFKYVFDDFVAAGVTVSSALGGGLVVNTALKFEVLPGGAKNPGYSDPNKIFGFIPSDAKINGKGDMIDRVNKIYSKSGNINGRVFPSDELKESFQNLMCIDSRTLDGSRVTPYKVENSYSVIDNGTKTEIILKNIDINKLLGYIYGQQSYNEEEGIFAYMAMAQTIIDSRSMYINSNGGLMAVPMYKNTDVWSIVITRINYKRLLDTQKLLTKMDNIENGGFIRA